MAAFTSGQWKRRRATLGRAVRRPSSMREGISPRSTIKAKRARSYMRPRYWQIRSASATMPIQYGIFSGSSRL